MGKLNFITVCWWLFILVWAVSALSLKPAKETQPWLGRLATFAFLAITFLFLLGKISPVAMNTRLWQLSRPIWLAGCAITFLGLIVAIWARLALGPNWSAAITYREGHELVQRGPYRFVRHPMYSGLLLMVFGTALVLGNVAGFAALLICFLGLSWKARQEEALLAKHFPSYPKYRARTKALIPYLF